MNRADNTNIREEPLKWAEERLFLAFGYGSPAEQMVYSGLLALVAYLASPIGLFVTVGIGILFTVTFLIGVARFTWEKTNLDAGETIEKVLVGVFAIIGICVVAYFGSAAMTGVVVIVAALAGGYLLYRFGGVAYDRILHGKGR